MTLFCHCKSNPNIVENYPTGIYAVTDIGDKLKDKCVPGVIFCLKQKRSSGSQEAANSLYPYYLVYVAENGGIHVKNTSPKTTIDFYKALCQGKTTPIEKLISMFNRKTKDGEDMTEYTALYGKAVNDIKGIVEKIGINSLFQIGQATLFENTVKGVDDFKLISFLVIK